MFGGVVLSIAVWWCGVSIDVWWCGVSMMFGGVFWCLSDSDEPYTGAPLYV